VVCTGLGQTTRTVVSTLIGEGRQQDLPRALLTLLALSYLGVWSLTHGYVAYPEWIAGHFFDQVEEAVGHAAMADTLGTAWIAIQCYALSAIAIAVLQGAGFTKHAFWIELTSVTVYIAVAYVLALEWTAPIHVIWRADWVYFGGILLGSAACLKFVPWRDGHPSLHDS